MAIPKITPLPPAPSRQDAPDDFTSKADAFVSAQVTLVTETNASIDGINSTTTQLGQDITQAKNDIAGSVSAASSSATTATNAATAAKNSQDAAKASEQSAATYAAAAGDAAGLPALAGNAGKVLTVDNDEQGVSFQPGVGSSYQEFTQGGTWVKPAGCHWVYVEVIGGGASGLSLYSAGSGSIATHWQGSEGGAFNFKLFRAQDLEAAVTVVVGAGGAPVNGSTSSQTVAGQSGGDSSFGSLKAPGGLAAPTTSATSSSNGIDRDMRGGYPSIGSGKGGASLKGGGAGASVIRAASTFTDGTPGASQDAGNGGARNTAGAFPGGGGGIGVNAASGAGAAGRVRVWAW